eukprot:TRINITY_DN28082_c0_g1_i1.p1 TRINITY_DN28082_c0_g1~~TRINITY_DN28082_c0_g1_i1.p1  ORF type:complete len:325 (+),score=35.67 TRINITY_DN28082_c0_g1_i1:67-1041(+)
MNFIITIAALSVADTWSESGKAFYLRNETELINTQCAAEYGCSLNHMWFGGKWEGFNYTRLRVFVDNETVPGIDGRFYMIHGMGYGDDNGPWSAGNIFGKLGYPSGIFNTFTIPFTTSIRITAEPYMSLTNTTTPPERFWFIFRGKEFTAEGGPYPTTTISGIPVLPPRQPDGKVAKLILIKNENITTEVYANTTLFSLKNTTGGVYLITISAESRTLSYLEGQVRGIGTKSLKPTIFSSGTEDYFLSTRYFNKGVYQTPISGLTHFSRNTTTKSFSAYRLHDVDQITFSNSYQLDWRCGEPHFGVTCYPCTSVFTYSWLYVLV